MTEACLRDSPEDDFEIGVASPERARAASEVGAAIAHQLSGPLTALLLYVGDLSRSRGQLPEADADGQSTRQIAQLALAEAERICSMVKRIGDACEAPMPDEAGVAHAREVISWWSALGNRNGARARAAAEHAMREPLTPRECEVLILVREGFSNKEGGQRMRISYRTFESHRAGIMRKFGARNAADLIRLSSLALSNVGAARSDASVQV